jgi:branched-chain amino acid transport system substrate-binding protein
MLKAAGAGAALSVVSGLPTRLFAQEKLKVAAIYTVPFEQQWVSRLHKAANAAKDRGDIEYAATENVTNTDYERVMREYAEAGNKLILGEVFGVEDAARIVEAEGGKIVGRVRHPPFVADLSSYLLQAQASGSKVIGLANAGVDTVNSIKQAAEFKITGDGKQRAAAMLFLITDVKSTGLQAAQGLTVTLPFYWDLDDETRAFSSRFEREMHRPPTMYHAGIYSAVTHYLKAVAAAGTDDTDAVLKKMREIPVNDMMTKNGKIRQDGRVMRDMYLFEAKKPSESKSDWDLLKRTATVPANDAAAPLADSPCPLVGR